MRADAERNRTSIIAAARTLYREVGPDASLETIAERAGVGSATLYRHFPDRGSLRTAILRERITVVESFLGTLDKESDAWLAFSSYIRFLASEADNTLVGVLVTPPEETEDVTELRERIRPGVRALIRRAKDAGALRSDYSLEDLNVFLYAHTKAVSEPIIPAQYTDRLLRHYLAGLREQ